MSLNVFRWGGLILGLHLVLVTASHADPTEGERVLTPNQERRVVQVNQSLPKDMVDQSGDSRRVAELRKQLRDNLAAYQQAVKKFGNGKPESRLAAHQVLDTQKELHQQFIQEEAIPAVASR